MGSLFGGKLSLAGHDVILYDIFRAHVDAINADGLAIEDVATGQTTVAHPKASDDPAAVQGADVFVVFVKSTTTEKAAAQFKAFAAPHTIAITLQNGLGNEAILRKYFGDHGTAAGVTSQAATFLGPGRIRHAGKGPTHLGMADGDNSRLEPLVAALGTAGFDAHVSGDVASMIWSKLVVNVGINALTALTGLPNGALLDYEDLRAVMADVVAETVTVARARGVALTHADPLATVMDVCKKTAANKSSMLQDILNKRESEIDFINGAIVREAQSLGIQVPANQTLARLVRALDRINIAAPAATSGIPAGSIVQQGSAPESAAT
jgi:2-dehydropantoate 2-reductase